MRLIDVEKLFGESFHYSLQEDGTKVSFRCICGQHHSSESEFNTTFDLLNGQYYTFGKCKTHYSPFLIRDRELARKRRYEFFQFLYERNYNPKLSFIKVQDLKGKLTTKETWSDYFEYRGLGINSLYLKSRGVPENLIKKFRILVSSKDDEVVFPLTDYKGNINGIQIRYANRKNKYKIVRAKRTAFSPLGILKEYDTSKPLYITEGMFGMLNMLKHGYQAVAVLGKSGMNDINYISQFDKVVGCFDKDEAGLEYAKKLLRLPINSYVCEGAEYDELTADSLSAILSKQTKYTRNIQTLFESVPYQYTYTQPEVKEETFEELLESTFNQFN